MKLGELREAIVKVMELGTDVLDIKLPEHAEVVVAGEGCWLRVTSVGATFLRGRWTLLLETVEPNAPMWEDDPAVTVVWNGAEKQLTHHPDAYANLWLRLQAVKAFRIPEAEAGRLGLFTDGGVELDEDATPGESGVNPGDLLTLRHRVLP